MAAFPRAIPLMAGPGRDHGDDPSRRSFGRAARSMSSIDLGDHRRRRP